MSAPSSHGQPPIISSDVRVGGLARLSRDLALPIFLFFIALHPPAVAKDVIDLVVGHDAPKLERLAASELTTMLKKLFGVDVVVTEQLPAQSKHIVILGSPQTNPAVRKLLGDQWPKVSDQGIVLRSLGAAGGNGLIVGGGSPVATFWAVFEFGYRRGVRYLLAGDDYPSPQSVDLSGLALTIEPTLRTRNWRTINDFAHGPESWGAAEHRKFLKQLAKKKFNSVMLSVWPWQPFVHYEFRGVKKQTATLWFDEKYTVTSQWAGRKALGGKRVFTNPDFEGKTTYEEMTEAGIKHVRSLIESAHEFGMEVGISLFPLEFPREFSKALPGSRIAHQLKKLTMSPGTGQRPDDPLLRELVTTKIRAYLETYPDVDRIYFVMSEFPHWDKYAEEAWAQLTSKNDLGNLTLPKLETSARERNVIASGDRGVRALRGNVVALAFYQSLFEDGKLLKKADGSSAKLTVTAVDPAFFPVLESVIPEGASALHFIDYTARRVVENIDRLGEVPTKKIPSSLIFTLADDNVGIIEQSTIERMSQLIGAMRQHGWDGFCTRYWTTGDLDLMLHYLSRASWDASVTPRSAHDDFWVTLTGKKDVSDRLWRAEQATARATDLLDKNALGFAFPVRNMFLKHYKAEPFPEWWEEVKEKYVEVLIERYRAVSAVTGRGYDLMFYLAKRSEFVTSYLSAVDAIRKAGAAKAAGNSDETFENLEKAIDSLQSSITSLAEVARDQCDRGLVAVLNSYAYVPLLEELEKLEASTE